MPKKVNRKITSPEPEQFRILGIASNMKPFSICWEINRILNTGLTISEPLVKKRPEFNDEPSFMSFRSEDDNNTKYLLVENVNAAGYFIDKWQMFRYILIVQGSDCRQKAKNIQAMLKASEMILLCAEVEISTKQENSFIKSYLL